MLQKGLVLKKYKVSEAEIHIESVQMVVLLISVFISYCCCIFTKIIEHMSSVAFFLGHSVDSSAGYKGRLQSVLTVSNVCINIARPPLHLNNYNSSICLFILLLDPF